MKQTLRDKTLYIGAGAGIVAFAVFGLLPGSVLGGAMGLDIAGRLLGAPVEPGIFARMLVSICMLAGVMASGLLFTVAGSAAGWLGGALLDTLVPHKVSVNVTPRHSSR